MRRLLLPLLTSLAILPACFGVGECAVEQTDDALSSDSAVADADASGRVSLRACVLTLTFEGPARFVTRGSERTLVLSGRSSRNLKDVRSFVPDDAFGETSLTSPRTFEIALRGA